MLNNHIPIYYSIGIVHCQYVKWNFSKNEKFHFTFTNLLRYANIFLSTKKLSKEDNLLTKLKTVNRGEPMAEPLKPIEFVVDTLIM